MARTSADVVDKNFIQGLITDYTALNFPENACVDTRNVVFDPAGYVRRRYGFDFEQDHEFRKVSRSGNLINSYLWREVNGNGNINLFVVQIGTTLYFYETSANSISAGALVSTVSLTNFATPGAENLATQLCQFVHGKGVLFVTHPFCNPFYVSYVNNVIAATEITVQIRDLAGVDDGLEVDERPIMAATSLTPEHRYNLYNQGWYFNSAAALADWDTDRSDLPSNSDVWWFYKDDEDTFDASLVDKRDRGNTPAPKGHYIVDAFNIDRESVSNIADVPGETTDPYRPKVVAFFAGRVWYGGVEGNSTINKLYFSQIIESPEQFGRCYQTNDPTSETLFDLLPTDGGVIEVSGAGTIYRLVPMGNALMVIASNGIWAIAGSQGIGFVANDYSVVKVSAVETTGYTSFVNVEGSPYWLTGDAVCTLVTQDNLTFQVQKVSDRRIQNFLLSIPEACKQKAVGSYNPFDRTIQWLFRSTEAETQEDWSVYDRILVLNLLTGAFYLHTIPEHSVRVHSIELFRGFAGESEIVPVVNDGEQVVDSNGDNVIIFNIQDNTSVPVFKYLVSYYDEIEGIDKFTFAELNNTGYVDWPQLNGVTYTSEFTTGYRVYTNGQRFFQSNYVFVFLEEEAQDSSCYIQAIYDYALTGDTGKFTAKQELYNPAIQGHKINYRRLKIRGKGRALQLRFTSNAAKPFTIIGWSIHHTANNDL
jgi:hypothetical protein